MVYQMLCRLMLENYLPINKSLQYMNIYSIGSASRLSNQGFALHWRLNHDFGRRQTIVTMRCERSNQYKEYIQKLKLDDTKTRKCGVILRCASTHGEHYMEFNVICGIHNHGLCQKLVGHPIVYRMNAKENKLVFDMTLKMVQSKYIFQL